MSAKSRMDCSRASISSRVKPIMVPFRYTFSMPVYSMLKPAPSSSSALMRPSTFTSPEVAPSTPVMIFSMVDFPEPLVPMMPTVSPRATSNETSRSA